MSTLGKLTPDPLRALMLFVEHMYVYTVESFMLGDLFPSIYLAIWLEHVREKRGKK